MKIHCPKCKGMGRIRNHGLMEKTCPECEGLKFIHQSQKTKAQEELSEDDVLKRAEEIVQNRIKAAEANEIARQTDEIKEKQPVIDNKEHVEKQEEKERKFYESVRIHKRRVGRPKKDPTINTEKYLSNNEQKH